MDVHAEGRRKDALHDLFRVQGQPKDTYQQRRATSSSPMPACPPSRTPAKRSHSTPRVSPGSASVSAYSALHPSVHQRRPRPDGDDPERGRGTRPARSSRGTRSPEASSLAHSPRSRTSASSPYATQTFSWTVHWTIVDTRPLGVERNIVCLTWASALPPFGGRG